ncbi:MAG: SDR family oxidoreductase [Oligoflexales bacterium]
MQNKAFDLSGKCVLITGAAGLLGVNHTSAILEGGGIPIMTDVVGDTLTSLGTELSERYGQEVITKVMDVADERSVRGVNEDLKKNGRQVSVLINNAARNPKVDSSRGLAASNRLEKLDLLSWQKDLDVGLTGALLCSKVFGTEMASRGYGVIINVASDLGVIAPNQNLYKIDGRASDEQDVKPVSYSVVKHGLIGLTKYLATYWADRGVRCNSISPGGVFANQHPEFLEKVQSLIPLGRLARPDEYKGAILFLASEASSYMNGANLVMDGGRSVW